MKKWSLFVSFLTASFKADLEYRINFLIRIVTDIFWYLSQVIIFEIIFLHTSRLGTWTLEQTRVFLGLLFFVDSLYMILFHDNLEKMSERVRKGELDMLLTKPIASQFLISLQRMATAISGNLLIALTYLTWSLLQVPDIKLSNVLWLFILVPLGLLSLYSIRFIISTLALIIVKAENIQYLWYQVYRLGMRPDQIYQPWLRLTIYTILPVGLIASLPSRILFDGFQLDLFSIALATSISFFYFSQWTWKKALVYYSSASS
jgi:ABC-2 type transport system permease protein